MDFWLLQKPVADYPWQATVPSILRCIKDEFEIANSTNVLSHQIVEKKLTNGALVMLSVISLFVILTLIRSLIGVYESCIGKKTQSSTTEEKHKARNGVLRRFLDCFCIKSNAGRLLNFVMTEERLCSLHGIRSLVLIWVLVGHVSMFYVVVQRTPEKFKSFLDLKFNYFLKNTVFIVDAFLVLGGFLNGYLFSQLYEKRKGKISWSGFYLHRILRISPMYFMVLGFYAALFPYVGSGPIWPTYETNPVCKDNWPWHVVFLNNFITHKEMCLTPTWYLACEMQLYIISPIFLLLLMRRPKIGYALIALTVSGSCFINYTFTKEHNLTDGVARVSDQYLTAAFKIYQGRFWKYFDMLYTKPYSRIGTFLIGVALGYYLYKRTSTSNKKSNRVFLTFGWIMSAILLWNAIFALYGREESEIETAIYNGLKNVVFSIGLCWIIFACVTGQGGIANRFLCNKVFIVISRLSYILYLIHMILIEGHYLTLQDLVDHSHWTMVIYVCKSLLMLPIAFVVSVIFEAPLVRITTLFIGVTSKEKKTSKQE